MNYRPTILVVDDSEAFAMYISLFLNRLGFNVVPTRNGAEALVLLKVMKPDMVIIDSAIQEVEGVTAPALISSIEHTSKVPVIITYSEKDRKSFDECIKRGHFGCLEKPINILEFHKVIEQCVTFAGGYRRKFLRTSFNQEVSIKHEDGTYKHYAVSLSEGGIYIRGIDHLSIGLEVEVSLKLNGTKTLNMEGTVIYKKDVYTDIYKGISGVAIEFKDLSKKHSKILRDYILDLLVGDIMEERDNIFKIDQITESRNT
jgi:CheY-like chemotaxis protein/Tfp pilus assembly protein PilZ